MDTKTIFLRFTNSEASEVEWVLVGDHARLLSAPSKGTLQACAAQAVEAQARLLISLRETTKTQSDLQVRGAKLLRALPYALEEQFAEDVDQLHFAAASAASGERFDVFATRADTLRTRLDLLSNNGINVSAVYAMHDALVTTPGVDQLLLDGDDAILLTAQGATFAASALPLSMLTTAAANAAKADKQDASSAALRIFCEPQALSQRKDEIEALNAHYAHVDIKQQGNGILGLVAANLSVKPGTNLLQGSFAQRTNTWAKIGAWKTAAILLLAVGLLAMANYFAQYVEYSRHNAQLDTLIAEKMQLFNAGPADAVNREALLESAILKLSSGGTRISPQSGQNIEFLAVLSTLADAITKTQANNIEAISYRNGVFDVRLTTQDAQSLDALTKAIADKGDLKASIQRTEQTPEGVKSFVQIKGSEG